MQLPLQNIASPQLVEILFQHTQYYMTIGKGPENAIQKRVEREKINEILKEIETREGFEEVFPKDIPSA